MTVLAAYRRQQDILAAMPWRPYLLATTARFALTA
jgi:hypothetical protein